MNLKELSKLNVLVIGLAVTGQAVLNKLLPYVANLKAVEAKADGQTEKLAQLLRDQGVEVFLGAEPEALVSWADIIIPSPGVSPQNPLLSEAQKQKTLIVSELEVAFWLAKAPIIAVTGTNGKTTTATLIKEILCQAGYNALLGGNIGKPFIEIAAADCDWLVIEVSSFQLAYTTTFKPKIAVLLNLQADHLDWHSSFAAYKQAKHKVYLNQTKDDFLIYNALDKNCLPQKCKATAFGIGTKALAKQESSLTVDLGLGWPKLHLAAANLNLAGEHSYENILAASAAAVLAGAKAEAVAKAVSSFNGLAHRLEKVATKAGVSYYNDSKATNPAAAVKAIKTFSAPVILIAGGQNKGLNFNSLAEAAKGRVKLAVLYGKAKAELAADFGKQEVPYLMADSFEQAVKLAETNATAGDVVLLSPACASFDLFSSYKERGNLFKSLVLKQSPNYAKTKL